MCLHSSSAEVSSLLLSSFIDALKLTTNVLSSGFITDGAGRHHSLVSEKKVALSFGRIILVSKCLLETSPHISEHTDYAGEDPNAEYHPAMDAFFPDFLRSVACLLRSTNCASVPRILCSSV